MRCEGVICRVLTPVRFGTCFLRELKIQTSGFDVLLLSLALSLLLL